MLNILKTDIYHLLSGKLLWICVVSMIAVAGAFCAMQYTALDYKVAIDRVIFLPMTFYGVVDAALIGMFCGGELSDGIVRNKIISGNSRSLIYVSQLIALYVASLAVYLFTVGTSLIIGINLFEMNVLYRSIAEYILMGILTVTAYTSFFLFISFAAGSRSKAVTLCMILSFFMLYLSLTTNSGLTAPEFKDGVYNIHYIGGTKRKIYELIHNINPTGQAAQLSMMKIENKKLFIGLDIVFNFICGISGISLFNKKNLK